ncbi:hypothetical protein EKO04_000187 [Ascochyta lentis]|uniref:Uncharacterized protein n=1 Tax=Ascochyta lentis TaxID=205686 RepID=A0A8H7JE71_9PLEO|nr:hypothetical protein EKO04_000187 [Ascochyta lentis]
MATSTLPTTKTEALYQKDGHLFTHSAPISSVQPLPADAQGLFKLPAEGEPYVLTTPRTIFHAQGGGQPSDTGIIAWKAKKEKEKKKEKKRKTKKKKKKVTKTSTSTPASTPPAFPAPPPPNEKNPTSSPQPSHGTASHYPNASFVEFSGLIPNRKPPLAIPNRRPRTRTCVSVFTSGMKRGRGGSVRGVG